MTHKARHAVRFSVILTTGLIACSALVPQLKLEKMTIFSQTELEYSPNDKVRVRVTMEKDYAEYFPAVERYDLPTIRREVQLLLSSETVTISRLLGRGHRLTQSVTNPFASAEEGADLELQILVDVFDYGDKRSLGGKIIRFVALGGIGLLGTGEQALCIASYRILETDTGRLVHEGTVNVLSGEGYVPRQALESVVRKAALRIYDGLASFD